MVNEQRKLFENTALWIKKNKSSYYWKCKGKNEVFLTSQLSFSLFLSCPWKQTIFFMNSEDTGHNET